MPKWSLGRWTIVLLSLALVCFHIFYDLDAVVSKGWRNVLLAVADFTLLFALFSIVDYRKQKKQSS